MIIIAISQHLVMSLLQHYNHYLTEDHVKALETEMQSILDTVILMSHL
jgi:hypothetical protein